MRGPGHMVADVAATMTRVAKRLCNHSITPHPSTLPAAAAAHLRDGLLKLVEGPDGRQLLHDPRVGSAAAAASSGAARGGASRGGPSGRRAGVPRQAVHQRRHHAVNLGEKI